MFEVLITVSKPFSCFESNSMFVLWVWDFPTLSYAVLLE